jgi:hypothetical protein
MSEPGNMDQENNIGDYLEQLLPPINELQLSQLDLSHDSSFIGAAGFEDRCFAFINQMKKTNKKFKFTVGIEYEPENSRNRTTDFKNAIIDLNITDHYWIVYNRKDPEKICENFINIQKSVFSTPHLFIDISGMSKFLIIVLLNLLEHYDGTIHIIYSEAAIYHPTKVAFDERVRNSIPNTTPIFLTKDIYNIVTTHALSSISMAGYPLLVIAFPTFNYQELGAILNEISPQFLIEIEGEPHLPENRWRLDAIREINQKIERTFGVSIKQIVHKEVSTFDYISLVRLLDKIYREHRYSHKCVIAPTGSKLQTLGVYIFKQLHPEIQLFYPVVKDFAEEFSEGYKSIYHVSFTRFSSLIQTLRAHRQFHVRQLKTQIDRDENTLIHILHLSDIHLGTGPNSEIYYYQLETDLKRNLKIQKIDYLIISGDIATASLKEEYDDAMIIIRKLIENFGLNPKNIIIVPGNHDINWEISKKAYTFVENKDCPKELDPNTFIPGNESGIFIRDDNLHKKRFDCYSHNFHKPIYGTDYPLNYSDQGILSTFPDNKILFLALNSSWKIDHYDGHKKQSNINLHALTQALHKIVDTKYDDWLKIGVLHHPLNGREMIENIEILDQLGDHNFRICLHGHIHEAIQDFHRLDCRKKQIFIIGAGTFGAPVKAQIHGVYLQYNLLKVDPISQCITVETRKKERPDGAWSADSRWGEDAVNNPVPRYTINLKNIVKPFD